MVHYPALLGNTDIYIIDQFMKGRYKSGERVLDAGCGTGRNIGMFLSAGLTVFVVDTSVTALDAVRTTFPTIPAERIQQATLQQLPFASHYFDHIVCSAVLHFAENELEFLSMLMELSRVLKPGGSLFIRTATLEGVESTAKPTGDGRYFLQDGTTRFLITRELLERSLVETGLAFLEPFKTSVVNRQRSMSTLILTKA